ncbi:MAG TPA: hypothetical protein VF698_19885 [Thermoanaerobaculia bacterium]|jgi:hypothetical protein
MMSSHPTEPRRLVLCDLLVSDYVAMSRIVADLAFTDFIDGYEAIEVWFEQRSVPVPLEIAS